MNEIIESLKLEVEEYLQALKCIRDVLDGFNAFAGYTAKQYSDALEQINDILQKHNL